MKYESPITYHSKDMANVKVFEKWVKSQRLGHKVKNFGINRPYSHRSHVESRTRLRGHQLFTLYRIACSLSQKNITKKTD
jgi:hypothetical protein